MSFDDFYAKYPNKKARTHANTAYDKVIKKGVSHEKIMAGLNNYLEDLDRNPREKSKIKHPATFLNYGCYDDEYEAQSTYREDMKAITGDEGESIYAYTAREINERFEAANAWWKEHGYAVALFWEYNHRRRYGEPDEKALALFEVQKVRKASLFKPPPTDRPKVKPNFVPMKRDVVRKPSPGAGSPTPQDASEVADNGVQPPEPPPVESEAEYGAVAR